MKMKDNQILAMKGHEGIVVSVGKCLNWGHLWFCLDKASQTGI